MRVSYMVQLVSNLATMPQRRFETRGIAHSTPSPVGEGTRSSFGRNLRSWIIAKFDFSAPAGNAVMGAEDGYDVTGIESDVPAPHLFLLDMKIGR